MTPSPAMVLTTINGRWRLLLPEHRAARPEWATGWEPERLASMAANLGPGHLVYDIGAEEGDFPALWAQWGCRVVLVEPNPLVWPNIRAIFDANQLVPQVAGGWVGFAGDEPRAPSPEWVAVHVGPAASLWPTCAYGPVIGDHGFLVLPERPDVPITTIDHLAVTHGAPTAITIDVEGAELTVLRGARWVLLHQRPLVWVSVHIDLPWIDEKYPGDTSGAVAAYLGGFGYRGRQLAVDHEEHWVWWPAEGPAPVAA